MKVLIAIDGSEPALHAVNYVGKLLGLMPLTPSFITLLSVHDDTGLRHAKAFVGQTTVADYLQELSEKELEPARKLVETFGIQHDTAMRTGHVAQEIVDCAHEGEYDLVVLGAKGRSALADMLIGSVAQRVLATAKAPVLLVK